MRKSAVALAALAAQLIASFTAAQTIDSFYADTSSYETPGFLIRDAYAPTPSRCLIALEPSVDTGRTPIRITLAVRPFPSCDVPGGRDLTVNTTVSLPAPLAAGTYAVEFGYLIDGNWVFRKSTTFAVDDGKDKCGRIPESNVLTVEPSSGVAADRIAAAVANPSSDPQLYEKLGRPISVYRFLVFGWLNLTYALLDDQQDIARRIDTSKDELGIADVSTNDFVCSIPASYPVEIVEFYNATLGHYFITENKAEIASIEGGGSGPGWQRTGERITGIIADPCRYPAPNSTPLYRFYGTRGIGPNSHFFTADRAECGQVRRDPGWTIENVPFRVWAPVAGQCPAMSTPVHRLYNGRAAQNDSNHRYASRQAIVDTMVAAGWTNEGVTFCIPQL